MITGIGHIAALIFLIMNVVGFVLTLTDRILAKVTCKRTQIDPQGKTAEELLGLKIDPARAASGKPVYTYSKGTRVPENLLVLIGMLFGGVGVMLGFFLARRGLYSATTRLGVPAVAVGETILLFWMVNGFWDGLVGLF